MNAMSVEKPSIILADWNEERGPLIIDSIFPEAFGDLDDSPEVLVTRCYINAQSIFARVEFSKINFSVPMVSIKKLAIVFFDIVPDDKVRGGKRPFILVVFVPIETSYSVVEPIGKVLDPFLDMYKKDTIPELVMLQDQVITAMAGAGQNDKVPTPAKVPAQAEQVVQPRPLIPHATAHQGQNMDSTPRVSKPVKPAVKVRTSFENQQSPVSTQAQASIQPKATKPNTTGSAPATPGYKITQKPLANEGDATCIPGLRKFSTLKFTSKASGGSKDTSPSLTLEQQDLIDKVRSKGWVLKSWNPEDLERLKQLVEKGMDERDIAVELHRELKQVQRKLQELKK
jgi:hypothetical protein